jgi:hypothetical protein
VGKVIPFPKQPDQPKPGPYAGTNYDQFFGVENFQEPDPFGGKIPGDGKGYGAFRSYYERLMLELLHGQGVIKITANCETKDARGGMMRMSGPKKEHFGSPIALACNHVIHQDEVHPEGVWFVPIDRTTGEGYWMCASCYKRFVAYKLDLDDIKGKCAMCVAESVTRIHALYPDRVHDLAAE